VSSKRRRGYRKGHEPWRLILRRLRTNFFPASLRSKVVIKKSKRNGRDCSRSAHRKWRSNAARKWHTCHLQERKTKALLPITMTALVSVGCTVRRCESYH